MFKKHIPIDLSITISEAIEMILFAHAGATARHIYRRIKLMPCTGGQFRRFVRRERYLGPDLSNAHGCA